VREDFESYADAEEPLLRSRLDSPAEVDVEQELLQAAGAEFREPAILPDEPPS
jgi:hypothetical protein